MRTARKMGESDVYHVVARGAGRQIIFEDDADRGRFLAALDRLLGDFPVELYAWCLMPNHVHLLLHAPLEVLSALMRRLLGSYALYFNAKSGRVGHLFQERFSSEPVDDDAYLLTVIRYIHQNPARAGISSVSSWPWSSYREYLGKPVRCSTEFPLAVFGGAEEFGRMHEVEVETRCLDVPEGRSATRGYPDERAAEMAREVLGDMPPSGLKALEVRERNEHLIRLKGLGLTIRQIERLTGIGRGTIQRVVSNPPSL